MSFPFDIGGFGATADADSRAPVDNTANRSNATDYNRNRNQRLSDNITACGLFCFGDTSTDIGGDDPANLNKPIDIIPPDNNNVIGLFGIGAIVIGSVILIRVLS